MKESRIILLTLVCTGLAVAGPAVGQIVPPQNTTPPPPAPPAPPLTIQDRIEQLERELANLQKELAYIDELRSRGGLSSLIIDRIGGRTPNPGIVEVGVGDRVLLMANRAKLLTEEEKLTLLADVVLTVNGLPVREQTLTEMVDYLKSYQPAATHEDLVGQAVLGLAGGEWPKQHFARFRSEAGKKIRELYSSVGQGANFENLAKNRSDDRTSAENGGDLGFIGRDCEYGPTFAKAAFSLKDGELSGIVSSPTGLHIIKRTGFEKGGTPDKDRVKVSHILVLHAPAPDEVRQSVDSVRNGRADIKVRDAELLRLMPRPYR